MFVAFNSPRFFKKNVEKLPMHWQRYIDSINAFFNYLNKKENYKKKTD